MYCGSSLGLTERTQLKIEPPGVRRACPRQSEIPRNRRRSSATGGARIERPCRRRFSPDRVDEQRDQAYDNQWPIERHKDASWDWIEVFRRYHRDADRLDMVLWGPQDRLCGLALGLCSKQAVEVRFVEGDCRTSCPLKSKRFLIFLECATNYAQGRGRAELRIDPVNPALERLYTETYGFSRGTNQQRQTCLGKRI
jgi:hypothetical protein